LKGSNTPLVAGATAVVGAVFVDRAEGVAVTVTTVVGFAIRGCCWWTGGRGSLK